MASLPKTKTTIVIDGRLLDQFRALVVSKHGSARMLSSELEEAIRAYSPPEIIKSLAAKLGLESRRYPSVEEVARGRPRIRSSAGRVVREMRDERARRLLGHK